MTQLKPVGVIFDMDGVIFDSERAYIREFRAICEEEGMPFIEEVCIESIGSNWDRTKKIYEKWYGTDWDFAYYYNLVRERMGKLRFEVKPYAHELFDYLSSVGIPCALASSTKTEIVKHLLDEAELIRYFEAIIGGDMVSHSKPHPEIFLTAAGRLGIPPEDCYVIEDSYNGIRAAHNAGMHPVMVPDILQPDDEIRALAQVVLPDLGAVMDYLKEVTA